MKSCLVVRHVAFEHLGTLELLLRQAGFGMRFVEAGLDHLPVSEATDDDLAVILGGPIGAYEGAEYPFLADEMRLIERRLASHRPMLGICLGAQLMAKTLGAEVYPCGVKEIGWEEVTLTSAGTASPLRALSGVPVLHWHGDVFDLPPDAVNLASTAACPHQAFALGTHGLALQFHAEIAADEIESWLIGHAVEIAAAGISPRALREATHRHGAELHHAARQLFSEWLGRLWDLPDQPR